SFSPNGRFLAGGTQDPPTLSIWALDGTYKFKTVGGFQGVDSDGSILSVRWSPDGNTLMTTNRKLGIISAYSTQRLICDAATISSFDASNDKASWYTANAATIKKTPVWTSSGHGSVWSIRFSPDGTRVAISSEDEKKVTVFAAQSGAVLASYPAPSALYGMD